MNKTTRSQVPLITVLMTGMFLAVLNQTLLNVALPHLMEEFSLSPTTSQWLLTGYMLINGILIPLSAFLIDRLGMRRLFLSAMLFFIVGSLVCGLAMSFPFLLGGRLIQAVGAGILMPLVMAMMISLFPPEMRGKGMGIFGLGIMFAPAIGPTLSGWILDHYSWRVLFLGLAPLAIGILLLSYFLLRDSGQERKIPFDLQGTLTSVLGFGFLLYGLSEAGTSGWGSTWVILNLGLGLILIILFVRQQWQSQTPMLDVRIFRYGIFSLSNLISVILTIGMFAGMFLLPIYLQSLQGFSAFEAGLLMLPGALIMGLMSPISGILFDRIGPRPLAIVGTSITLITTYLFSQFTLETSYNQIMWINMVRFFGLSLLMMPITTAGLNQLPQEKNKHGTAITNTTRQIAGSIGISLLATIFSARTDFHLEQFMDRMQTANAGLSTPLPASIYEQYYAQASMMGIHDAFLIATLFTLLAFILSFFLRDVRTDPPKHHES